LLLWIEIDGSSHDNRQEYDTVRDSEIHKYWIEIIRYTNDEVLQNLKWVYDDLMKYMKEREKIMLNW